MHCDPYDMADTFCPVPSYGVEYVNRWGFGANRTPKNRKLNRSRKLNSRVNNCRELQGTTTYPVIYSLFEWTVTCHFEDASWVVIFEKGADCEQRAGRCECGLKVEVSDMRPRPLIARAVVFEEAIQYS